MKLVVDLLLIVALVFADVAFRWRPVRPGGYEQELEPTPSTPRTPPRSIGAPSRSEQHLEPERDR